MTTTRQWVDPDEYAPEAVIKRTGRWTHLVYISHGLMCYGPGGYGWHVVGARRAARKASRELRRYLKRQDRDRETRSITEADLAP